MNAPTYYIVGCPECGALNISTWNHDLPPGGVNPIAECVGCGKSILSESEGEPCVQVNRLLAEVVRLRAVLEAAKPCLEDLRNGEVDTSKRGWMDQIARMEKLSEAIQRCEEVLK